MGQEPALHEADGDSQRSTDVRLLNRLEHVVEPDAAVDSSAAIESDPPERLSLARLMIPRVRVAAEWQAEASDIEIASYETQVSVPIYPIFGPPPPMLRANFSYVDLSAPVALDLPTDLYEYSLGVAWMRPINDRWMTRFTLNAALATDGKNVSSDAWQFRGGAFAMYRPNEEWTWIIGALALGRNDIPVVPAVGAIWQPRPDIRFDLTFPRPRVSYLVFDRGPRQHWGYIGGGLTGGTWAYERAGRIDDQITYRDWRLALGWESLPTPEPGLPFARGRKFGLEIALAFGREFEFESELPDIDLDETLTLRAMAQF